MGRGRLPMKLIEKEKSRKATFQKRKNNVLKKAHELHTLCQVDVCVIVYSTDSINKLPETYPKEREKVVKIIEKYKEKTKEKSPKNFNVMDFFKERKNKVEAEASKLRQERLRKLYPTWDFTFDKFNQEHLRLFASILDSKIESCQERINMLKKKRYKEEKQQKLVLSESSSNKSSVASASNRSHLSFMHNNDNNNTTSLASNNHQILHPFNLIPLTMITPNDDSASAATQNNDSAFGHFDLMKRESYYPSTSSWSYTNNSSYNDNYYSYLQNNGNIVQIHHQEANLQVNDIPAAPMNMMQEFQTYQYGYNNQHDQLLQVLHQFNYMDHK